MFPSTNPRTFDHWHSPARAGWLGDKVELSPRDISDAGLREVLQTPGASLGSWALLDALLDPTDDDFRFLEPLGHSRELKTALSGIFGRFVARAYAEQHLKIPYFAPITSDEMVVEYVSGAKIRREQDGDLPDWITWKPVADSLAIIEAKGSHEVGLPKRALKRAKDQAKRVEVELGGVDLPIDRYAIATSWTSAPGQRCGIAVNCEKASAPGSPPDETEKVIQQGLGVARAHAAALLAGLGHTALADHLRKIGSSSSDRDYSRAAAADVLARTATYRIDGGRSLPAGFESSQMIGAYVLRSHVAPTGIELSPTDLERLRRLDLAPVFVGVERTILELMIAEDSTALLGASAFDVLRGASDETDAPRGSGAGDWIIRDPDLRMVTVPPETPSST